MSHATAKAGVTIPRDFDPDVLYVIGHEDEGEPVLYVRTPDGVGAYWYDTRDEAEGDVSDPIATRYFDNPTEFDEWREAHS